MMRNVSQSDPIDSTDLPKNDLSVNSNTKSDREQARGTLGGLYDGFEAYRTPTSADYRALLTTGMVVLDANVLIDLYRYHKTTRDEFIRVLESLEDILWFPNQVVKEFWNNRDNIIKDPREVDKTARELQKHLAAADGDLHHWAKRVRLPNKYVQELAAILSEAFTKVVQQVQQLAVDDGREFARDTNGDPLLASLEPILKNRVGPPFDQSEYQRALTEARRRGKERIPPGYMDMGKEGAGPAGDYLVWAQLLIEAKRRQKAVLFVTSDNKEDWWRKDKNDESVGPRPELAEELRSITGQGLFMLPPDSLLNRAREVLRVQVSEESVQDVKQTSRTVFETTNEKASDQASTFRDYIVYEQEIRLLILQMGYNVTSTSRNGVFDLLVQDNEGHAIYVELKYAKLADRYMPSAILRKLSEQVADLIVPVLLVSNMTLGNSARTVLEESNNLDFIIWTSHADDSAFQDKLREMFMRIS
jgi:predicted nucleic acid-binding protein